MRLFLLLALTLAASSQEDRRALTSTVPKEEFGGWQGSAVSTKKTLSYCLELAGEGLGYQFGSSDPESGGMDCSGAIFHVLEKQGFQAVPRSADGLYRWVWEGGKFHAVNGRTLDSWEWEALRPGDLIFWAGTYDVGERDPPVSHVMMFLGRDKEGEPLVFGASEGRQFRGERRDGVSVFSLSMPSGKSSAKLLGYGPPPSGFGPDCRLECVLMAVPGKAGALRELDAEELTKKRKGWQEGGAMATAWPTLIMPPGRADLAVDASVGGEGLRLNLQVELDDKMALVIKPEFRLFDKWDGKRAVCRDVSREPVALEMKPGETVAFSMGSARVFENSGVFPGKSDKTLEAELWVVATLKRE